MCEHLYITPVTDPKTGRIKYWQCSKCLGKFKRDGNDGLKPLPDDTGSQSTAIASPIAAPKPLAPTHELAYWFVNRYYKRLFDFRLDRQRLAEAKELVNPPKAKGWKPYPVASIKGCLMLMERGEFDWTRGAPQSIRCVLWGDPPHIQQYEAWCKTPPPCYELSRVKEWESLTGKVAYPEVGGIIASLPPVPSAESVRPNMTNYD